MCRAEARRSRNRKRTRRAGGWTCRSRRVRLVRYHGSLPPTPQSSQPAQLWAFSMVPRRDSFKEIYVLKSAHGVFPRTGKGVAGAEGEGDTEGDTGALIAADRGEAPGVIDGPG